MLLVALLFTLNRLFVISRKLNGLQEFWWFTGAFRLKETMNRNENTVAQTRLTFTWKKTLFYKESFRGTLSYQLTNIIIFLKALSSKLSLYFAPDAIKVDFSFTSHM